MTRSGIEPRPPALRADAPTNVLRRGGIPEHGGKRLNTTVSQVDYSSIWSLLSTQYRLYTTSVLDLPVGSLSFPGPTPGLSDFTMWPFIERLPTAEKDLGTKILISHGMPQLAAWRDRMMGLESVKNWFVDEDIHAKFIESERTGCPDYNLV